MTKRPLRWNSIKCTYAGKLGHWPIPQEIDRYYAGTLLSRIFAMKKQKAISLEEAVLLLISYEDEASAAGRKGTEPGHLCWYGPHFIEWLSSLGYHIELSGDEFEAPVISDKVI